jgi:excinuclease ABC subunit C
VGAISIDEYKIHLEKIKLFLKGQTSVVYKELAVEMKKASSKKQFEKAARLRDQIKALNILNQRQTVQFAQKVNWDFWSTEAQNDTACVNLLKIREGKLIDSENFVVHGYTDFTDKADAQNKKLATRLPAVASNSQLATFTIQSFLEQYYIDTTDIPKAIFTQTQIENAKLIEDLLKTKIDRGIKITTPSKGKKAQVITLSQTNAKEGLRKYLQNNATDKTKIQEALTKLQQILKLPTLPRRIECYDISNTQGTNPVGSMVVFINGEPAKSEYRKFKIRIKDTPDDFSMMREMLSRRLARISNIEYRISKQTQKSKPKTPNTNPDSALKSNTLALDNWPTPDLIVIDGGKGQLSAAQEVLHNFKFQISNFKSNPKIQNSKTYNLPTYNLQLTSIIGLAKRIEEIFVPHKSKPIILDHSDPTLQLLQRLRDEAHRFAITFHRSLRSKQAIKSELDEIKGVGPKTKKLLKQHFGTVKEIKNASLDELAKIVGNSKAKIIKIAI